MKRVRISRAMSLLLCVATLGPCAAQVIAAEPSLKVALATPATSESVDKEPIIPRFSVDYLDKSVKPGDDFYKYANGAWMKNNPVPADKARWGSFSELAERNNYLIHSILDGARADTSAAPGTPKREVGDFFASAMDTATIEKLKFDPISKELASIDQIKSTDDLLNVLAQFHKDGIGGIFDSGVEPDAKDSSIYAFQLVQGGLSLPDRDYYLTEAFATQRAAYSEHLKKMFVLLGEPPARCHQTRSDSA